MSQQWSTKGLINVFTVASAPTSVRHLRHFGPVVFRMLKHSLGQKLHSDSICNLVSIKTSALDSSPTDQIANSDWDTSNTVQFEMDQDALFL